MSIKNPIIKLIALLMIAACSNPREAEKTESSAPTIVNGELILSSKQLSYAHVEYGSIQKHRLSNDVNARGELVLPVNAKADLVSLYPGIIKSVYARQGARVVKGQLLASLNSPAFIEAQQYYLMVKNQLGMLEQEYERQKELNKDKIASDKYYQKALSGYNVALAEYTGLALQLEMAGVKKESLDAGEITAALQIISPLSGHIEHIDANPGKYVMQDERLMQVINRDQLLVELNVFEKDIMKIASGQRVTFKLSNLGSKPYEAKIVSVGNIVRKDTRVVKVLAEISDDQGRMLPGMFVASEIHTGEDEVDALPEEAVLRMGNDDYVIFYTTPSRQGEEGTSFISVPVITGNIEDGYIEVSFPEEIPTDAMIVIKGGYYLKTELAKQQE